MSNKRFLYSAGLLAALPLCAAESDSPDKVAEAILGTQKEAADPQSEQIKVAEQVRRQGYELEARLHFAEAEKQRKLQRFEEAEKQQLAGIAKLKQVATVNGQEAIVVEERKLAQIYADWAVNLRSSAGLDLKTGDIDKALGKLDQAKTLDPNLKATLDPQIFELKALRSRLEYAAEVGQESLAQATGAARREADVLFQQAQILFAQRRYSEALEKLDQVFVHDNFHQEATHLKIRCSNAMREVAKLRHRNTITEMNAESDNRWLDPVNSSAAKDAVRGETHQININSSVGEINRVLNIVVPKIKYENESIEDVIRDLFKKSRDLDPEKRGLNIILNLDGGKAPVEEAAVPVPEEGAAPAFDAEAPAPAPAAPAAPAKGGSADSVTLEVDDMRLGDIIKNICNTLHYNYKIEEHAVIIAAQGVPFDDMVTRFYPIPAGVLEVVNTREGGAEGEKDWVGYFKKLGVDFPVGAKVQYVPNVSRLVVSNSADNQILVENILKQLSVQAAMVSIESKMIETRFNKLDELGFSYRYTTSTLNPTLDNPVPAVGGGAGGAAAAPEPSPNGGRDMKPYTGDALFSQNNSSTANGSGALDSGIRDVNSLAARDNPAQLGADIVFGHQQVQAILRALDQRDSDNVMAAPKVTTVSGSTAIIRVIEEHYFPKEWEVPEIQGQMIVPSSPTFGEATNVGFVLEVTPQVDPDGYTIDVEIKPTMLDFIGYDVTFNQIVNVPVPPGPTTPPEAVIIDGVLVFPMNWRFDMPILDRRSIETKVKIWDGETVMMGGLIRERVTEVDDGIPYIRHIPLIGRLFENKGTLSEKKNTIFLITTRIINSAGTPLRSSNLQGLPDFKRI
ncbi:MAG: hypothetical protein RL095_1086 [Verrucomicrobiota bacterium]|jgi:general secretion pathway protein D